MPKNIFIVALFLCSTIVAQKSPIRLYNNASVVQFFGSAEKTIGFQNATGIQYKKWAIGIGTGVDTYAYTSIPIFIEGKYFLTTIKKWQPYLYVNGGISFVGSKNQVEQEFMGWNNFPFVTTNATINYTFAGEAGMGVSKKINTFLQANFAITYNYKHLQYYAETVNVLSSFRPPNTPLGRYDYYMRRWSVKLGICFIKQK